MEERDEDKKKIAPLVAVRQEGLLNLVLLHVCYHVM